MYDGEKSEKGFLLFDRPLTSPISKVLQRMLLAVPIHYFHHDLLIRVPDLVTCCTTRPEPVYLFDIGTVPAEELMGKG